MAAFGMDWNQVAEYMCGGRSRYGLGSTYFGITVFNTNKSKVGKAYCKWPLDCDTTTTHSRHNRLKFIYQVKIFSVDFIEWWCPRTDSNRGPIDYKSKSLNFFPFISVDTIVF